jgi:GNAT superfamily N-acetyltransferase
MGPSLVLRCRAIPHLLLNRVYDLAVDTTATELDGVLACFRDEGLERFMLHVPADGANGKLASLLEARDFERYHRRWVRFRRDDAPLHLPKSELAVEVLHPEHAADAAAVLAPAFDLPDAAVPLLAGALCLPGWHSYFVRIDDELAGVGVLRVEGEQGYLAMAATKPNYRGRGIQGLLMATRVRAAIALGCTELSTETGEAVEGEPNSSFNNMLRCGFEPALTVDNWVPRGVKWMPD